MFLLTLNPLSLHICRVPDIIILQSTINALPTIIRTTIHTKENATYFITCTDIYAPVLARDILLAFQIWIRVTVKFCTFPHNMEI